MPDSKPLITVAICTYNRHEQLKKILPAVLMGQALSQDLYKVLIVDNSDDKRMRKAFAEEFSGDANLSIIESSPPGLSRARNVALEACTTRYIAYLDDDALPKPEWLSAVLRAFATHDPAVVAGPIYPVWPGPQPDWLPGKYVGCLTILDHGQNDRWLTGQELAYGANMAFKADSLRQVGGFNIGLGRRGPNTLLSEEELEAQLALRQRGQQVFYAACAGVFHTVHSNRLSRNYFRARMAWQAVSALLREPPLPHFDWSQQEIRTAATKLGVGELIARLLTYRDAETFSAQLDIIYHLFAILLESKDLDDLTLEKLLSAQAPAAKVATPRSIPRPQGAGGAYKASAPILPSTRHLIVEGQPAHFFLYALYAGLENSQLQVFPNPIWHNFDEPLAYLERSITPNLQTVTFVTLDPLVYGASRRAFNQLLASSAVKVFGILHRLPETVDQADALKEAAPRMAGIMVLSRPLIDRLQERFQFDNVSYLPIHPPFAKYVVQDATEIRARIGVSDGQVVFSMLGESRKGKGVDVLLEALDHVPASELKQMFFLVAGRAQHFDRNMIANALREKRVRHHIDLRSSDNPLKYAVLSEREFGEYVSASDVGLVLYQHEQRGCMSGVAPNYIWGTKPLVAFSDSVIGRTVAQNELGLVVDEESPQAVAQALVRMRRLVRQGWTPTPAYSAYRAEIAPAAVLNTLAATLGDPFEPAPAPTPVSPATRLVDAKHEELPANFSAYLSNLPLLHSWDGGASWNTGGFQPEHLANLYRLLREKLPPSPMLLETGAGNSTICLLFLHPRRLVSIAPEAALFDRIRAWCDEHSIPTDALDARVNGSEWELPQLALEMRDQPPQYDFALIDGCHNWPMVFVDFCYANHMLKAGGLIMVDDVNLHSVKELARMLSEHKDFSLELDLGKSLVFRRMSHARTLDEWTDIPYISRMTRIYSHARNPFSLNADVTATRSSTFR
jgi:GT2 family glycosyltransferase